jgi:hypothetical protein
VTLGQEQNKHERCIITSNRKISFEDVKERKEAGLLNPESVMPGENPAEGKSRSDVRVANNEID